jgi:hypothetical protein
MTIDDALRAMAVIDGQNDGSQARAALVEALHRKLIEAPENFWEEFFAMLDAAQPSPTRQIAEHLLRSGAVTTEMTFGDVPAILAWDEMTQRGDR